MNQQHDELTSNQTKWDSFLGNNHSGYVMKQSRYCFCPPEYWGPFLVVVNSTDDVISATYLEESEYPGMPVDLDLVWLDSVQDAFNEVEQALIKNAHEVEVTYDPVGGFPAAVYIDWEEMMIDEETSFSIGMVIPF